MQPRSTLGIALILLGINGITFTLCAYLMAGISHCLFTGVILLACILLFAGIVILRNRLTHSIEQ